jgi:hypothetical protein
MVLEDYPGSFQSTVHLTVEAHERKDAPQQEEDWTVHSKNRRVSMIR